MLGFRLVRGVCELIQVATLRVAGELVTSMRSVADLLVSRSCNETHWHRSLEGMFPPAASLSHLCRRMMPIVLRRPTPMELAELVAGATIKRRLCSKQSIQRCLTRKQPPPGNSLPNPAWNALFTEEREKCATLWSTGCIENSGIQDSQGHGGQSATKSCSSNNAGGRQTHAVHGLPGERQIVISSCVQWEDHGAWSGPTDGQFSTGSTPRRRCMSKARCWWMPPRERLWSGSGELHPVRNFLEMYRRRKRGRCYKSRGSSFTDAQKQS